MYNFTNRLTQAYELATLTGTQVLLLVVSQTGLVYTFTTPKLEAVVREPEGRNLIQDCLNAPDPAEMNDEAGPSSDAFKQEGYELAQDDEQDDDDDDDEDGQEIGRADAGLTAQALNATAMSSAPFSSTAATPLFHPGWAPSSSSKMNTGSRETNARIKRQRTQPNLSSASFAQMNQAPELTTEFYGGNTGMPTLNMNRSINDPSMQSMPMFYPMAARGQSSSQVEPTSLSSTTNEPKKETSNE